MDKIFSFIVNRKTNKLLLLLGSPEDPQFHKSFWYVVTGGKEDTDTNLEQAVVREIKEETNLDAVETLYLKWIFKYKSLGNICTEYVYVSFIGEDSNIVLNEESIDYKWCDVDEFIELIEWSDDKEFLREVVKAALNKEVYIKEEKVDQYF
ncbi:MAG: NUDIX domain-containing protein [Clostridia bacterium]|nr:NUDIX domain-containing protein [Clostridia bacterium]